MSISNPIVTVQAGLPNQWGGDVDLSLILRGPLTGMWRSHACDAEVPTAQRSNLLDAPPTCAFTAPAAADSPVQENFIEVVEGINGRNLGGILSPWPQKLVLRHRPCRSACAGSPSPRWPGSPPMFLMNEILYCSRFAK